MLYLLYQVETQLKHSAKYPAHFSPILVRPTLCRDPISRLQACEPFHSTLPPDVWLWCCQGCASDGD